MKNSIGSVECARATRMKLSYALIQNRAGKFVTQVKGYWVSTFKTGT